jgi:divalent metal cation (Fe/Co/Zn/Cd) transporter
MDPRATHLRRAVWLSAASIGWSAIVGTIAVYAALVSRSLSLLGFGGDAVLDAVVSVTLVWRFVAEARQPERAARVERLAEGAVGVALIALAVYLVVASIRSLAEGARPEASTASIALLLASVVVLPPLAVAKSRVAAALGSGALRADSILTAVAALLAGISLASLAGATAFGLWWADAVAALVVAAVLAREGWASVVAARSVT